MSRRTKTEAYLLIMVDDAEVAFAVVDHSNWEAIDPDDPGSTVSDAEFLQEFELASDLIKWCHSTNTEIVDELVVA
jgi:hypothetical protein